MKAVGFDFDGTLANVEVKKSKAFGKLLASEWKINHIEGEKHWMKFGGSSRREIFNHLFNKKFNKKLTDKEYKLIEAKFSKLLKTKFYPKLKLLPSALNALKYCRKNFDILFVSSGVPQKELEYILDLTKVSKYFDKIFGTNGFKNKEDHFKKIKSNYNLDKIIFVADGLVDMKVGKKFRVTTIGIPSNHSKKELENAGASYVCDMPHLVNLVNELIFK